MAKVNFVARSTREKSLWNPSKSTAGFLSHSSPRWYWIGDDGNAWHDVLPWPLFTLTIMANQVNTLPGMHITIYHGHDDHGTGYIRGQNAPWIRCSIIVSEWISHTTAAAANVQCPSCSRQPLSMFADHENECLHRFRFGTDWPHGCGWHWHALDNLIRWFSSRGPHQPLDTCHVDTCHWFDWISNENGQKGNARQKGMPFKIALMTELRWAKKKKIIVQTQTYRCCRFPYGVGHPAPAKVENRREKTESS